ncbi:hypothetical protein PV10_03059 [Exophiala mesophila]|uniref:Zn(2)-C6 fungal-type domain-containing protein n=1 Tax=Exophiala mesophila TaxID=212818 RepID=A0A0D1X0T6_EXOME|nr:uncharacterized protein PV10_03059 [Exophiala mesophila]KIV95395.1 hypothetical protein PV10_03059 [Exophiala mesophila]
MPRPKVRPEDRQRAAKACLTCKASKKRCDAQLPCSNCVRRNKHSQCSYEDSDLMEPPPKRQHRMSISNQSSESASNRPSQPPQSMRSDGDIATPRLLESSTMPQRLTRDRLLLSSKGEQVYIGKTASLSFLQFLRHTIRQQMGPSVFTENNRRHHMLEVNSPEDGSSHFSEDDQHKRTLVEAYHASTNGLLDLYSRDEVDTYLNTISTPNDVQGYSAIALDLIVAIGGQCRAQSPTDSRYAIRYFTRAQKAALAGMLEDPCLDMVRCFLLMAFYMLGACRRNAAFMYIGVAAKAASALGLHVTEQYHHFAPATQSVRLRTLKSLRILDIVVSSILGRPVSTPTIRIDTAAFHGLHVHAGKPRDMALNASFGACSLIAEIMQTLDADNTMSLRSAEQYLKRLRDWSSSLPKDVKQFSRVFDAHLTVADQERVIGNIHVACIYYFAVMLITRPFLISHLMENLPGGVAETPGTDSAENKPADVENMAEACVDSAMYMAQICHEALQSGLLMNAMCIVKAWMFAAGLVIGFSMFAQAEPKFEMDEAFNGAREVLKKLSPHSPQAEHYYEILTGFADAIQRHRQHLAREKRRSQNKYVNQILTFDVSQNPVDMQSADTVQTSRGDSPTANGNLASILPENLRDLDETADFQQSFVFDPNQLPVDGGGDFDFGIFGWDNFAMQVSENFNFDTDLVWDVP